MWTKKETQQTIKALRKAGYFIQKFDGTYKITSEGPNSKPWTIDDKPLFSAMPGMGGYLVKYHDSLFESDEKKSADRREFIGM